jgi:predicted ATPase
LITARKKRRLTNPSSIHSLLENGPLLDTVTVDFASNTSFDQHPFSLPIIKHLGTISFPAQVTFLIGENGTGKSTILEAIACKAGFGAEGGSININFKTSEEKTYTAAQQLAECMRLSWRFKPRNGFFFRAESFFNIANYIDYIAREGGEGEARTYAPYGGKSLHAQSHGESFLAFFSHRLGSGGFFIFDEPEAALSPQRQLSLLAILHEMCKNPEAQFIIATHSPLLLAFPGATIYSCDSATLTRINYHETAHYQLTKNFLENPEHYFKHLFT